MSEGTKVGQRLPLSDFNYFKMNHLFKNREFGFQKSEPTASLELIIKPLAAVNTKLKNHGKV